MGRDAARPPTPVCVCERERERVCERVSVRAYMSVHEREVCACKRVRVCWVGANAHFPVLIAIPY
jgi:hypothetical protein